MENEINKSDWLFWLSCLVLGIIAEEAFFRGEIGISNILFLFAFYSVFFWKFKRYPFTNQRLGYLVISCIWLLGASFFISDNKFFYVLNILAVPFLVMFHLLLITGPKCLKWNKPRFLVYIFVMIIDAIKYIFSFVGISGKSLKQGMNESRFLIWKKVMIGIVISIPVLFVVLNLLMAADSQFERIIGGLPIWAKNINPEFILRFIAILMYSLVFFGFMQVLFNKYILVANSEMEKTRFQLDGIIMLTVLVLLNVVYIMFTIVQFKYFFSGTLQGDYTYAQYARRGFFELLFATLINLTVTVVTVTFVNQVTHLLKRFSQIMLTILLLASGVMLTSAFLRLLMYEEAYGFTFTRVLVHSFMIFLVIIFAYTLIKIWLERVSLFHFYFITSLIFYTGVNILDLDRVVVNQNISRYEQTGKIDLQYLNHLSNTGLLGLIDLYEKDPHVEGLKNILLERKKEALTENHPWQSFNLTRQQANKDLKNLHLSKSE
ncbi:DUF4173 domain-containing protein [Neobacillus sp. PS3-40]|uniref:DUF4153 domain-containing protein n=1 Tax=Neobacillus sp. PS3-40 TaxID=3070679 RepID=UPI0027DFD81E|nr:DUF4173 domain-containing protein [Neobacillus sp. PS3-40]WML44047.1 DUF4173 domain-containing protein [Neobacillus sp. PS3-40]